MTAMEYLKTAIAEEGISQNELASRLKWSRQRIWDMFRRNNPNFVSIRTVLRALDRDIDIRRKDGQELDFDKQKFYQVVEEQEPMFGKMKAILDVMGYELVFVKGKID